VSRIALASIAMGGAAFGALRALEAWLPGGGEVMPIVRLAIAIGIALLVLAASAWLLRIREFNQGVALVSRRFRRSAR
jgi:hypothetical protein